MGSSFSSPNDRIDNLKLEAQKITDFSGSYEDWQVWKNRTECAFGGSGYENVLLSSEYAKKHPKQNKVVYSQLAIALADGTAYHIVFSYDKTKDGHAAWQALCTWYDGDDVKVEAAQTARSKLDTMKLYSGSSASDFVNKFLNQYRLLVLESDKVSTFLALISFL